MTTVEVIRVSSRAEARSTDSASESNPPEDGFNFTRSIWHLCTDITQRLPAFRHVDMNRVAISYSQARKRVKYGLFATTTPMRFEGGQLTSVRDQRIYEVQRLYSASGVEMLYIISFYLPRFLDIDYREKLVTIFHELWHISPEFNGDLRRHAGRCYAHSHSQKEYDRLMEQFLNQYLAADPPETIYGFLQLSFRDLKKAHGKVHGIRIPHPKLIPVAPTPTR